MDETCEGVLCEKQAQAGAVRFRMICSRICGPGAPEYALDVQRYVRGFDLSEDGDSILRMALYCEGDSDILAFCEFGWIEASDSYAISYIATALTEQRKGLGAMLLATVLRWVGNDSVVTGRDPYILTQIAADNHASAALFGSCGFSNEGVDGDDPEYHIWSREVERFRTDRLWLSQLARVDD